MAMEPRSLIDHDDGKSPMNSKKFIAYLVAELAWKIIIVTLILSRDKLGDNIIMLTVVLVAGFIEVLYVGGQAALDRYIHLAKIASVSGKSPRQITDILKGKEDNGNA